MMKKYDGDERSSGLDSEEGEYDQEDEFDRDPDAGEFIDQFGDKTMKSSDEKADLRKTRVRMEDYNRKRS